MAIQVLGHASCPKVHDNPHEFIRDLALISRAGVTACARGATLVNNCLGAQCALLIMLLGSVAAVQ